LGGPKKWQSVPLSLRIGDARVKEGNTDARFTASLSVQSQQTVTVDHATANGSAKAPADLTASTGPLTISFGETSKTVEVAIRSDRRNERNETFFVDLSNTSTTIADASGKGTISSRARSTRTGGSSSVVTGDLVYRMVRDTAPPEVRLLFAGIRKEGDTKDVYALLTKSMRRGGIG
jgi:hypothetical protein